MLRTHFIAVYINLERGLTLKKGTRKIIRTGTIITIAALLGITLYLNLRDGSQTVNVGDDAVDFKLISLLKRGDICVSQDYGVAAMALGKGCYAIHQSGKWYTNENIDQMLMERHLAKKARRATKKHHLKGPAKRTLEDDLRFEESFEKMIRKAMG